VGLRWGGDFKYKNGKPKPDYVHFEIWLVSLFLNQIIIKILLGKIYNIFE
jgi:hypothetical protein